MGAPMKLAAELDKAMNREADTAVPRLGITGPAITRNQFTVRDEQA
jgi:hypothetical protein